MSKETKEKLLDAGAVIAGKVGVANVTRRAIATKAKVSEALVSHHLGARDALHKALKRHMKKNGYVEPDATVIEREGKKLRAKKNPAPARKYTAKEVKAMQRKGVVKKTPVVVGGKTQRKVISRTVEKVTRPLVAKKTAAHAENAATEARKSITAARAPKLPPPQLPLLPALPVIPPPLPRIEDVLEKKS
jgi:AcrR family transcriptional regulator